nr:retrovirus-related Pol polyprotein from transposon TNT 1-94 [Tanacetum cinerariifolium]
MGTLRETLTEGTEGALHLGPERPRVYSDLTSEEKDRYNADIQATNILLQRLPKDIYSFINDYTDAKDIWDNVKILLEGSELTKEDRESQLYDDFEHFQQNKGETIHDYYVRFAKLINDMRNIKMNISRMQLNSKFVNNMLPEWGRFVTVVKLKRGLKDSNYDQLYAYLKQHEVQLVMRELRTELGMLIQVKQDRLSATTATKNGVALDEEQLLFIEGGQDNAFNEDVDEQPVHDLALDVDNVFQSVDCDVFDSDDGVCEHHEVHEMHDDVQPNYGVDSHADYTSDNNMIPYDQYVKDNAVPVVQNTMADMNIPTNDAPTEQAPAVAPPTRTDDQILPSSKWVPIDKSNYVLNLDEKWFNLHKDILRDALDITPINDSNPYVAPPSSKIAGYDRKNLATASHGKKKTTHLLIPNIRFTKLIIHHLKTKHNIHPRTGLPLHYSHDENVLNTLKFVRKDGREIFGMPIPDALLTDEIKGAPYYGEYQDVEDVPVEEPAYNEEEANLQWAFELSLKEQTERTQGPARSMVIREPDSKRIQPLPDVQGKRKENTIDEQAAHDLLTLLNPKNKSHAGPNPGIQDEGQARLNPGDATESQPQSSHVVHAGPNREHMKLEATDASTRKNPEQMDEEFTTTAYPNVQENLKLPYEDPVIPDEPASSTKTLSSLQNLEKELSFTYQFFIEKQQEEDPGKTNAKAERIDELEQHMANLLQYNLALEESDLPAVDIKEILQQQMFEDKSYKAHEDQKKLYDALEKSKERDYPDQLLSDLEEARQTKRKRCDVPRTPSGSPPPQPPPLPPSAGASGAPGTSGASGSSQFPLPPPPPPPSTDTSRSA